jgi:exosortase
MTKRKILLLAFLVAFFTFYFPSLRALVSLSYGNDAYEYILVIPFISGYFLFKKRKSIINQIHYSFVEGSLFLLAGMVAWLLQSFILVLHGALSIQIFSMLTIFTGGMVCLFGTQLFKNSLFSIIFLFLMIPLPGELINHIISFYQSGTATVADGIFKISGITYFRDGLSFYLPNLSIHIAPECSGIHSSTALIITGIIAGKLFLRTIAGKTVFILLTIPLALVKNGIRVATLSLLGAYIDMSFINGPLHHKGGGVFFLVALVLMFGGMFIIKGIENRVMGRRGATRQE